MENLAQTKDFCPNRACPDYGDLQSDQAQPNLQRICKNQRGVQHYQCKTCGKTFTETTGTIISDGWGGIDQAILEVYGLVPEYSGRCHPPTRPKPGKDWLYRQMIKHRDKYGRLLDVRLKVVWGKKVKMGTSYASHGS